MSRRCRGVDGEEGQAALLGCHHGEAPGGVEGEGEGPAGEQVVRATGPSSRVLWAAVGWISQPPNGLGQQ